MLNLTDDIVELNRDVEPLIVQGTASRTRFFKSVADDKFTPLQFVHFSDIHAVLDLWNRTVEYINYYKEYISFGLHSGDYCGNNQQLYADFYNYGIPCDRPIYNCVGNHDTIYTRKWIKNTKESAHKLLFAPMNDDSVEGTVYLDCDFSMTYYKDFPKSNLRLIVLDQYYDIELQCEWLKNILNDAREKGLCVITSMHEPTAYVHDTFGVTFHSINDWKTVEGKIPICPFEPIIADFIKSGGCHIVNLVGHVHHDLFGMTDNGVLNSAVPSATNWDGWCDGKRIRGTRTYDCFNVVSIDANLGLLKIVRVGNNVDHYFRSQRSLCFDYINKKVISNN